MEKVLLTTGGTGGHIFPALAVAEALRRRHPQVRILFAGSQYGPEARLAAQAGLEFVGLPVRGLVGRGWRGLAAAAGMAAHLAGVLAAHTTLPVIGIPIGSAGLGGMDALLATVQMPSGIPVATVAVNGAANAAFLAIQMLALSDDELAAKLEANKQKMAEGVAEKDAKIAAEAAEL